MTREQFIQHVEGTQEAFRRFLTALCCGDGALADDIAQDSYIKAYLSCSDFKRPNKFNAWIFKIGYNTFVNHKRGARPLADFEEVAGAAAPDTADSHFRYQDLYAALGRLSGKERMSLLLFYMEGYSIKEIAEIEGSTQDAVKQHLARGRNHLRGLLSHP